MSIERVLRLAGFALLLPLTAFAHDSRVAPAAATVVIDGATLETITDGRIENGRIRIEAGKIVAIVCHGTCVLLKTKLSNGDLLVKGKTWTGFANSEEAYADAFVGQKIQPFWIEEEAKKLEGTNFVVNSMFKAFAVRDGNLITGQQQNSGAEAARLVIEALGR